MKRQILIPIFLLGVFINAQQKVNNEELQRITAEEEALYQEAKIYESNHLT